MSSVGVMLLSNNENSSELYNWISQRESVVAWSDALKIEDVLKFNPQLVISYNYVHIVPKDIIDMLGRRIINMHISFLPYNRGSSPNLWSFIEDTPKGVTIHQMSEELDRGGILLQKELHFDETKETFRTAYDRLQKEIVRLCEDNWEELYNGKIQPREQTGVGSYHSTKDLQKFCEMVSFTWDDNIAEVKMKYKKLLQLCDA